MNPLKSLLYSSLVLVVLLVVVSCGCENLIGPDNNTNPINTGTILTNVGIPIERPLYIVSIPENSITKTVSIDTNILDLYLRKGYDPDEFSVTHVKGVDDGIINVNALNFDADEKTLQGTIALKQKLDFENPTDGGENSGDNDYEIALFRVISETSSNDFKLIVRITDAPDSKKLEILIDSYHLDDINQPRGLREIYLYENSQVMDPLMGDDSNNFLIADLVESRSVRGDVDASTDLTKLYDQDDRVDAFLTTATSVNSNSNTYHRISLEFTEELYIQKVAIRGRQLGGYYGFVFILRDKEDRIIYVHQVSNPSSRSSGSEVSATSTYAFVPDYANFQIIDDYRIQKNNMGFDIVENTTNVLLIDNFFVVPGYEYERGFVSIDPGADFDKFNTEHLYFLDNELVGLSFNNPPDAEDHQDADGNGLYELGTVTITNFDRGSLSFALPVRVVDVHRTVSLTSNQVSYRRNILHTSIIEDLTTVVHISNFENSINLGAGTYKYQLTGEDAHRFRVVGNTLKTAGSFGFRETNASIDGISNDPFNVQVIYIPEEGTKADGASLNVSVTVAGAWRKITEPVNDWPVKNASQIVSLTNGDILAMAGHGGKEIWVSQDGGLNWDQIALAPWPLRFGFQAVVTKNNKILMMGGRGEYNLPGSLSKNNIWSSSDGGKNWTDITPSNHWSGRLEFQAVVLTNGDVLVIGGNKNSSTYLNDIWRSSDNGRTWSQIINAAPWSARRAFQSVVLSNNDILIMGGEKTLFYGLNDVWRSRDGGTSWVQINEYVPYNGSLGYWNWRSGFRTLVLDNGDIVLMGGDFHGNLYNQHGTLVQSPLTQNDVYISRDGGVNWDKVHNAPWISRRFFGAVTLPGGEFLITGGSHVVYDETWQITDSWKFENTNPHYQ